VSWLEQKSVAILLTLLHLNIQNIRLGTSLPAFVTPNMLKILAENYKIKPISDVKKDVEDMLLNK
jgi:hydroxylamine reductase